MDAYRNYLELDISHLSYALMFIGSLMLLVAFGYERWMNHSLRAECDELDSQLEFLQLQLESSNTRYAMAVLGGTVLKSQEISDLDDILTYDSEASDE